jgi:hypothetical protein
MKIIKLNDVEYMFKNSIDDLTIKDYFEIQKLNSEREVKTFENDAMLGGTVAYVERDKESEIFIKNKNINILSYLSKIPVNIFIEYPFLSDELNTMLGSFKDDSAIWETKEINNKIWCIEKYTKWIFQEWCDMENYVTNMGNILYIFYVFVYMLDKRTKNRKYDRYQNINNIKLFWEQQPAKGNINTILDLFDTVKNIKKRFFYIYENKITYINTYSADNIKKYHKLFGWEDTIIQIAQTNLFTSTKGNLHAVRNGNCFEILEFLNMKTARDIAENADFLNNQQKK